MGRWTCLAGLCALGLLGCASSDEEPAETSAAEHYCRGLCKSVERCGFGSAALCTSRCIEEEEPWLSQISVAGAALLEPCAADLSCHELTDEAAWEESFDACWERAKAASQPTAGIRAFCQEWEQTFFQCAYWESTATCEENMAMWADGVIDEAASCMHEPSCDQLLACVEAVFS